MALAVLRGSWAGCASIQRRLAPLKIAYNGMVGHQRAAFLAQIIGYITGRVTKADERRADTDEDDE
jgi:hypothetical protein